MKVSKCKILLLSLLAFAVIILAAVLLRYYPALSGRKAWKDKAVSEISRSLLDKDWLASESNRLRNSKEAKDRTGIIADTWLSDKLILFGNGEWLVYKSHCSKVPPHNIRDIFIAKGSDGKWYYSTCHFCIGMLCLVMNHADSAPRNLSCFVRAYNLVEFDGKSDKALEETRAFPDNAALNEAMQ